MNKKVISSVLAGAMAVSTMGVVASAAKGNTTEGNVSLSTKASMLEAVIDATLPTDLETFINPYGAQVNTTATVGVLGTVKYSDGIISPTYSIKNEDANVGLKVTATAKITPSSTVAVNTKVLDEVKLAKATEKQVFAFLNTTTDVANSKPVFASTTFVGNNQQVAFTEDGTKAANIMNIEKSATGYFYVGGQCTPNPETAWDSKDTITIDLVLDLAPSAGEAADLTLKGIQLVTGTDYKDFDAAKTTYELAASGSKTKVANLTVEANAADTEVYVRYNGGKLVVATVATATDKVPGITLTTSSDSAGGKAVVTPLKKGTPAADADYEVGDKIEFVLVNKTTNESATYTFNFT